MRIGVMSDSHGNMRVVMQALEKMGSIDLLLHAGDHYQDAQMVKEIVSYPVIAVGGNCDLMTVTPREHIGEYGGKRIMLVHGHQYAVKRYLTGLQAHAQKSKVDIVVFGHTHIPWSQVVKGIFLLNPGSVAYPRYGGVKTFGLLIIDNGVIDFQVKPV